MALKHYWSAGSESYIILWSDSIAPHAIWAPCRRGNAKQEDQLWLLICLCFRLRNQDIGLIAGARQRNVVNQKKKKKNESFPNGMNPCICQKYGYSRYVVYSGENSSKSVQLPWVLSDMIIHQPYCLLTGPIMLWLHPPALIHRQIG